MVLGGFALRLRLADSLRSLLYYLVAICRLIDDREGAHVGQQGSGCPRRDHRCRCGEGQCAVRMLSEVAWTAGWSTIRVGRSASGSVTLTSGG